MRAIPVLPVCAVLAVWTGFLHPAAVSGGQFAAVSGGQLAAVSGGQLAAAPEDDSPVLIRADELRYDRERGSFIARGKVEIHQGERVLRAERLEYNAVTGKIVAEENIVLHEPGGQVVFAERMELDQKLANGVVESVRLLFTDDGRLVADQALRSDSGTLLRRGAYSRCRKCEDDPEGSLLWSLVAGEVFQDIDGQEIIYRDLVLEVWGLPVLYLPYFWHPGPKVERKSGLLTPEIGLNQDLGARVELPYHHVIDPSRDLTVTPIILGKENPLMALEYRQRFDRGVLRFAGSGTRSGQVRGNIDDPDFQSNRWRGHVASSGQYHFDRFWRSGFAVNRASDRTYLKRYGFSDSENTLHSQLYVERFEGRSHFRIAGHSFQDLRSDITESQPYVAPLLEYSYIGEGNSLGGRPSLDINSRYLYRRDQTRNLRISLRPGYRISRGWAPGFVTAATVSMQLDTFAVKSSVLEGIRKTNRIRATPRATLDWRMPFVRATESRQDTVEPIALVVLAPNRKDADSLLDEESFGFDTDDSNLFSDDRFPGFDRVEDGQRLAYGLKAGTRGEAWGAGDAFLGQSYRLGSDSGLGSAPGVTSRFSDYVGRVGLQFGKNLDLLYRFKFSRDDFTPLRHAVSFFAGSPHLRVSGEYLKVKRTPVIGDIEAREELKVGVQGRIARFWTGHASTRIKLDGADRGSLDRILGLRYEDECFVLAMEAERTFTRDVEVEPQTRFLFRLLFKFSG